jgi:hypothetical protein
MTTKSPFIAEAWIEFSIGISIVILRLFARWKLVGFKGWRGDDYMSIVAALFWTVCGNYPHYGRTSSRVTDINIFSLRLFQCTLSVINHEPLFCMGITNQSHALQGQFMGIIPDGHPSSEPVFRVPILVEWRLDQSWWYRHGLATPQLCGHWKHLCCSTTIVSRTSISLSRPKFSLLY